MRIYIVRNRVNGKVYIGQTVSELALRWGAHISYAKRGRGLAGTLQHAIREFGAQQFEVKTLWLARALEELDPMEKLHISIYQSANPRFGYNRTKDGKGCLE